MKAISLWEPWASLVRTGAKKWETRPWSTKYRGELLICAAKRKLAYELIHLLAHHKFQQGLAPLLGKPLDFDSPSWAGVTMDDLNFGMAVAVVDLVDCKPTESLTLGEIATDEPFGDFSLDRFAWKLVLKEAIEPFPVKGSQRFFEVEYRRPNEQNRNSIP